MEEPEIAFPPHTQRRILLREETRREYGAMLKNLILLFAVVVATPVMARDHARPGANVPPGGFSAGCNINPVCQDACINVGQPFSFARAACVNACWSGCNKDDIDSLESNDPSFDMSWTITNSTGQSLEGAIHSQDRHWHWEGYKIANGKTANFSISCHADENVCYGFDNPSGDRYWGTAKDDSHSCTICCWKCGRASPRENLVP